MPGVRSDGGWRPEQQETRWSSKRVPFGELSGLNPNQTLGHRSLWPRVFPFRVSITIVFL